MTPIDWKDIDKKFAEADKLWEEWEKKGILYEMPIFESEEELLYEMLKKEFY